MLKPHISDYVRGFSMDDIENEREYEEWAQAGKPETVEPVACPQGVCKSRAATAGGEMCDVGVCTTKV